MNDDGKDRIERRWRATNAALLGSGLIALVLGVVLVTAVPGVGALAAGIALVGLGGIALVSLVFLVIGQGEERDRAQRPHG